LSLPLSQQLSLQLIEIVRFVFGGGRERLLLLFSDEYLTSTQSLIRGVRPKRVNSSKGDSHGDGNSDNQRLHHKSK
jgi:hypothetical protein